MDEAICTAVSAWLLLADLAEMGFDAVWGVVGADDAGAPHRRKRLWILAYSDGMLELQSTKSRDEQRYGAGDGGEDVAYSEVSSGGRLNPEWVEWLMGWPIGHTALKPLETDRYQEWLRWHGKF